MKLKKSPLHSRLVNLLASAAMLVVLFLSACDNEKVEPQTIQHDSDIAVIKAKLQSAGFDLSEGFRKFENGYIIENDIFMTEKMIDQYLKASPSQASVNGRSEQYRTNNLVLATNRTLRVFMDVGFGTFMQNAFDQALARYNAQNLGLTFQRTTNQAAADINIISFYEVSSTLGISAGFPVNGNPASPIRLNTYYYNNSSSRADATTVIAHEIGHTIGFRHTDYMNRTFSCGAGGNEGDAGVGANPIPGTPTTPEANSWMLACSSGTDRPFTNFDRTALITVYPRRIVPFGTSLIYRYYNGNIADHFYTANWAELGGGRSGYILEGVAFYANSSQAAGTSPVYRYYNGGTGDHFYTTNWSELGGGRSGYTYEGVGFYGFTYQAGGTVPVYRYYNGGNGDHFYTTNWGELGSGRSGYTYEGIGFYEYPY